MSFQLFDRLSALFKNIGVFRQDNLFTDQPSMDKAVASGNFINYSSQQSLLEQTNLHINRLERSKDYDQMDEVGEITLALDIYADESSLLDPETHHSLMVKSKYSRVRDELEELFYSTLMIDNNLRPIIRYLCKYGDYPAEIVTTANRDGVASIRFMNVYNFTRVETKYGDLVGFFYQDDLTGSPEFFHPWQVIHMRLTSYDNLFRPYGKCEKFGTRVLTPSGYKNIEDFVEGDDVCVFHDGRVVNTKVVAACHSGDKEIYQIRTRHYQNECSGNHPVLIRRWAKKPFKFGQKWFAELVYKRADELLVGDELVVPRVNQNTEYATLGDVNGNIIRADEQFARFFGFLLGDGWLQRANGSLKGARFALGEHSGINDKYELLLNHYSPNKVVRYRHSNSKSTLVETICGTYSKDLAEFLNQAGFIQGCKQKRVPGWAYNSPRSVKMALVDGFVDADGSVNCDKWKCERFQIEISNYELLKDLKMLINDIGWKCSNITKRNRKTTEVTFNGKQYNRDDSYYMYFYKTDIFEHADSSSRFGGTSGECRKKECMKFGKDVLFEPVTSITTIGEHPTADIQVEHVASNFIADGVVVHNSILNGSRKHFKELRLMEDAALVYRLVRAPEKRIFKIPIGQIPPHEVPGYMEQVASTMKKKRFFDPATGEANERWNPLIQEDDFWLPVRPDGTGPDVTTLPGAENLDQIADIEYFKKKMIHGLKIPLSRVGIGDSSDNDSKPLSQVAPEFSKAVQWIQREAVMGFKKLAIVHLALRGFNEDEIKSFDLYMTASSAIDELYRIETWNSRADVIDSLKGTELFPDDWILKTFTNMTEDEIKRMKDEKQEEYAARLAAQGPGGGADQSLPELPIEGYNHELEALLNESMTRKGRIIIPKRYESGFEYMLNNCELDGMRKGTEETLLVEGHIDKNDAEATKSRDEIKLLLENTHPSSIGESSGGTITEDTIPS